MTPKNWIVVARAEHARLGRHSTPGFMQVCHGKLAPLKRVSPGDRVAYYAPTVGYGAKDSFQSFVSIGIVQSGEPYAFDTGGGFVSCRRDVNYLASKEACIRPLLDDLDFVEDRRHWGYKFRFGLFQVSDHDIRRIAQAMQADLAPLNLHDQVHGA